MRRFTNILLSTILFVCASCVQTDVLETLINNAPDDQKGVLLFNLNSRSLEELEGNYVLCIYQNNGDKSTLVRKYSKKSVAPEYIWLLNGNYTAVFEMGKAEPASFNNSYYYGEESFEIKGAETTTVKMTAVLQNIPVKVSFDETIKKGCLAGYMVEVFATDNIDAAGASTPQLKYTEDATGYFIMPKGVTTLSWRFTGTYRYDDGEEIALNKCGTIENVAPKKQYSLSFKYSPDTTGFFGGLDVVVDTTIDERNDHIAFSPDPELKGDGFDLSVAHNYIGGSRRYVAKSPSEFTTVRITVDGVVFDPVSTTVPGVTLEGLNTAELYITLSDNFFNSLSGGEKRIEMYVEDSSGSKVSKELPYNLQGVNLYSNSAENLWAGTTTLSATVFNAPSSVEISYREGDGEWKSYSATATGANNTYTAAIDGVCAGHTYEYNLTINGTIVGASRDFTATAGAQIPNGDLEDWCKDGDGVIIPWSSASNPYWCTGNYGTAILSKNITTSSEDVRPGSTGKNSMKMESQYIVVKFAAGNGYIGSWGGMNGTNAKVYFGQPFTYNAKPKAIRFWAKWNCGEIDRVSNGVGAKGDPDLCKIFCCMCDWTSPHLVDSSEAKATTFSPSDENIKSGDARYNGVLYSAYMETTTSQTEWKQIEIPFNFYGTDANKVPNHIVLTFTCSGYGDFFSGSTKSWMYVDDIELVY